jgi:hypothetical protein
LLRRIAELEAEVATLRAGARMLQQVRAATSARSPYGKM